MFDSLKSKVDAKRKTYGSRLPQKLLSGEIDTLSDYELFEMLLLLTNTRAIARRLARSSFAHYQSLHRLLTEEPSHLREFGINEATIGVFDLIHESSRRLATSETKLRPLLSDTDSLAAYLDIPNRSTSTSHLAIILLNGRNQILEEITFSEAEEPASIVLSCGRRVLEVHASAIILATIRPGQTVLPASRDVDITRKITKLAAALAISFHEHIIFTHDKSYSLKFEVDLTSCSSGLQSIYAEQGNYSVTLSQKERSLGETSTPVSGFADAGNFVTLSAPQCAETAVTATPCADFVKGSHKLRTLSDANLMGSCSTRTGGGLPS